MASTVAASSTSSVVGVGRVVGALDHLVAVVDERVEAPLGEPAGHEDAGRHGGSRHQWCGVVDRPGVLDADGEAEAVDGGVVAHGTEAVHLVRRDVHEVALGDGRGPRRRWS